MSNPYENQKICVVGYTTVPRLDVLNKLPDPRVPKNYKRAEAIEEYIEKARNDRSVHAARTPYLSKLSGVCVLDTNGKTVFTSSPGTITAYEFLLWKDMNVGQQEQLLAIDVNRFLRTACADIIISQVIPWSERRSYDLMSFDSKDLYEELTYPAGGKDYLTLETIFLALGLMYPGDEATAEQWAVATLDMAGRGGLLR